MSVDNFDVATHMRRVCYYTVTMVILLAGVTVIAWGVRNEANFAAARASSFWAFYNAKSMQDLRMRLEMKRGLGAVALMPNATASGLPGTSPSGSPAPSSSGSPAAQASATPTPAGPTAEQTHNLTILDRDRDDARQMAMRFEDEAAQEKDDALRFAMAQIGLMMAICLCALGGPTRSVGWCYMGVGLAVACIGLAGYSYFT